MHYYRIKFFDQLQLNKKKASCNSCSTNLENIKLSMVMSKQNVKTNNIDDIEETVDLEKFLVEFFLLHARKKIIMRTGKVN